MSTFKWPKGVYGMKYYQDPYKAKPQLSHTILEVLLWAKVYKICGDNMMFSTLQSLQYSINFYAVLSR